MIYEFHVNIGDEAVKVFLQDDYFNAATSNSALHKHFYTEIQIVYDGEIEISTEKETYTLVADDIIVIPANCYHWRTVKSSDAKSFAFSVNYECEKILLKKIDKNLLISFVKELSEVSLAEKVNKIAAYISLFWCYIFGGNTLNLEKTQDYSYIINKFFEDNYNNDITLSDLAEELSLSEKQASRLVVKYTGNNFRTEITKRRVTAAEILLKSSNLSKSEIAEQLGYTSYSCLWKAMKTFKEESIK